MPPESTSILMLWQCHAEVDLRDIPSPLQHCADRSGLEKHLNAFLVHFQIAWLQQGDGSGFGRHLNVFPVHFFCPTAIYSGHVASHKVVCQTEKFMPICGPWFV